MTLPFMQVVGIAFLVGGMYKGICWSKAYFSADEEKISYTKFNNTKSILWKDAITDIGAFGNNFSVVNEEGNAKISITEASSKTIKSCWQWSKKTRLKKSSSDF